MLRPLLLLRTRPRCAAQALRASFSFRPLMCQQNMVPTEVRARTMLACEATVKDTTAPSSTAACTHNGHQGQRSASKSRGTLCFPKDCPWGDVLMGAHSIRPLTAHSSTKDPSKQPATTKALLPPTAVTVPETCDAHTTSALSKQVRVHPKSEPGALRATCNWRAGCMGCPGQPCGSPSARTTRANELCSAENTSNRPKAYLHHTWGGGWGTVERRRDDKGDANPGGCMSMVEE